MNQSELAAYILTRERIVNQIDAIETQGGSKDTLKRLRRFGNAFSWYPEFYPEILEDIGGMSDKKLMSALRTEDGFMKLITPVKGLPIHHVFASRTGGDLPLRTPADVFLDVRQRTFDRYGFGAGPNPLNLGAHSAFDNRMHMQRWGNKGTPFSQERGLGMAPEDYTGPVLHSKQTKDIGTKLGQDPALLRSQSGEIFEALVPYLDNQYEAFNDVTDYPVTRRQRAVIEAVDPEAFATGRTTAQSQAVAKAVQEKGLDVEFAKKFDFSGSTVTTNFGEVVAKRHPFANRLLGVGKKLTTAIPGPYDDVILGTGFGGIAAIGALATGGDPAQAFGDVVSDVAVGDLQGGELFDESQDFGEVLQQNREQNVRPLMDRLDEGALGDAGRAMKRGSRFNFDAGVVKIPLPEFGFSEFFGFN